LWAVHLREIELPAEAQVSFKLTVPLKLTPVLKPNSSSNRQTRNLTLGNRLNYSDAYSW
jgi:hypothetical protein